MHFGSPSGPSQTTAAEAKPRYVYSILKPRGHSFRRQVRLPLSKAKPRYVYSILKPHSQSSSGPVRPLLSEAKPSYILSILKPHSQSSKSPVRPLSREAKPSCVHTILKKKPEKILPPQSQSQAVVCVSTPRMYPRSGYFLVSPIKMRLLCESKTYP